VTSPAPITIDADLLARHDRPGPRYTSYPTAIEFDDRVGPKRFGTALAEAATRLHEPLSLYVHLPFCAARCSFCACHVVVSSRPELADAYLRRLLAEASLLADALGGNRPVAQYHWGGGTPTHHSPDTLASIHQELTALFRLAPDAEVAVEVDPRVTTTAHLEMLAAAGFNRLSLGVQDLDPTVQGLIGRNQTRDETVSLYQEARRLGFESINFDLVYGLPGQSETSMTATLETVTALRPDRLAVYSYAHVPWMRPHQKRIKTELLPDTETKFALLAQVVTGLTAAGYRHIGIDHFALPDDELVAAADAGTLTRNFMGYTTRRGIEVVGLGTSAISDVSGLYAQGHRRLASYYEMVDRGELPIERGYVLAPEDLRRRGVITEIMCNGKVDLDVFGAEHFTSELARLETLVDEGLVTIEGTRVTATALGQLFLRRIAVVFDAYTSDRLEKPAFSRVV
jgi:oxygen-independent coproporphyrinogen III oxidase